MAYSINLNEDKTAIVVQEDVWTEGAREIGPDGYLIGFNDGERAACYGATDEENLLFLCQNHFNFDVTTYSEAVEWFKTNVGPVFYQGLPL
jgi:hypothetical protein